MAVGVILPLDTGELERYAKARDDLTLPEAKLVWCARDTANWCSPQKTPSGCKPLNISGFQRAILNAHALACSFFVYQNR